MKIPAARLDWVMSSPELREDLRHRFRLTIELDDRYRVLALVVAQRGVTETRLLTRGIDVGELRELALIAWSQGFEDDDSFALFENLLEELVGLGILRRISTRYALRNPNVLALLGTREEIDRALDDIGRKPTPQRAWSPEHERRAVPAGHPVQRSPLSRWQEGQILQREAGVVLVAGLAVAGIATVPAALREAARGTVWERDMVVLEPDEDLARFRRRKRTSSRPQILVVPNAVAWSEEWIEPAARFVDRTATRVVFCADPAQALRLVQGYARLPQGLLQLALAPWSASTYAQMSIDPIDEARNRAGREAFSRATGDWGPLVAAAAGDERPPDGAEFDNVLAIGDLARLASLLADWSEPVRLDELTALADMPPPRAELLVDLALRLAAFRGTREAIRLDPLLERAVVAAR